MMDIHGLAQRLASGDFTLQKLADESGVILDVESLKVFTLNETGVFLVEALKTGQTVRSQLVADMVEVFDVDNDRAAADLEEFLSELGGHLGAGSAST